MKELCLLGFETRSHLCSWGSPWTCDSPASASSVGCAPHHRISYAESLQGISQCCKSSRSAWRAAEKEQRGAGNGRPWKIAISCLVNIFPWQQGGTAIYLEMQQVPDIRPRALSGNFPGQSHFPIFLSGSPSLVSSWNAAYVSPSASWAYTGLCEGGPPPPAAPSLRGSTTAFLHCEHYIPWPQILSGPARSPDLASVCL